MDAQEISERAAAFANSIKAGRITYEQVVKSTLGWVSAGFLTGAERNILLGTIQEKIS